MIYQLIFNLFMAHVLGDFYLQGGASCSNKVLETVRGKDLWLHALIIGALAWVAVWDVRGWWLALGIFVSHLLIDWLKSYLQVRLHILEVVEKDGVRHVKEGGKKPWDLCVFLADQVLHLAVLAGGALWWFSVNQDWSQFGWLQDLMASHPVRVKTAAALLLALKPANILVLLILGACKVNTEAPGQGGHGNFHSGELIGWLERGLILLFVVMSQYEAIGFLVAAKSILRFGEASKEDEKSEYVLTGTLLSLAMALGLGLLVLAH